MKQTNIQRLIVPITVLCLSSAICYHTGAVVDPDKGLGLAQQKTVPEVFLKKKSFTSPKIVKFGQQEGQYRSGASADQLRSFVPLLKELENLTRLRGSGTRVRQASDSENGPDGRSNIWNC